MTDAAPQTAKTFPVPSQAREGASLSSLADYEAMYARSIEDPEGFWSEAADRITWMKRWDRTLDWNFEEPRVHWYDGGTLNVSANCLDRHLETRGDQAAIIWEGDSPGTDRTITYRELHAEVCKFANALKDRGIQRGDRVCLYMPMIPELAMAVLACARIGAIHNVVFGGFSADSLRDRITDSTCKAVVTADEGLRGTKAIPLKAITDEALEDAPSVETVVVVRRTRADVPMKPDRDIWWHEAMADASPECEPEEMRAEDPLFILYTSGSTGKPKGVLHTSGGYLVYAAMTHKYVFDYREGDIYWCTADIGWITGHSYIVYGPLANGATTVMFEGVPTFPDAGRFWQVAAKHKVNIFYTAPTAIRALMKEGNDFVTQHDRSSIRVLGTVGEPINHEAWMWYHEVVGERRCAIVDTWWQTETGGIMITPLPGVTETKPGSATRPFFGIRPALVDEKGEILEGNNVQGNLCITFPWPGMARTVYGDHERFRQTYFSAYPGRYFTGDGCKRDEDGYYWITGRVDDVINVSGHRMGTAEVESALDEHPHVAESAVVGMPHDVKGQGIYAYVILKTGVEPSGKIRQELVDLVRKIIGPIATPDVIQFTPGLPKTRSGKIMRRILRKIAEKSVDNLGDTSTLADPSVVDGLIEGAGIKA